MKEIIIKLTAKEVFGILRGGVRKAGRRKAFGAFELNPKINKQVEAQLTKDEIDELYTEWKACATVETPTPPKKKVIKKTTPKITPSGYPSSRNVLGDF